MPHKYYTSVNFLLLISATCILSCSKSELRPVVPEPDNILSTTICSQTWMTRNLDVVTFRNGDTIPYVEGIASWTDLNLYNPTSPAWCYFHDNSANDSVYGKLYNWAAMTDPRGLAPEGWHVATYEEWIKLVDSCLGGKEIAGKEMKEAGFAHWPDHYEGSLYGNNLSGLDCLPGGYLAGESFDNPPGKTGNWWCDNRNNSSNPNMIWLYHVSNYANFSTVESWAVSVRCVKD